MHAAVQRTCDRLVTNLNCSPYDHRQMLLLIVTTCASSYHVHTSSYSSGFQIHDPVAVWTSFMLSSSQRCRSAELWSLMIPLSKCQHRQTNGHIFSLSLTNSRPRSGKARDQSRLTALSWIKPDRRWQVRYMLYFEWDYIALCQQTSFRGSICMTGSFQWQLSSNIWGSTIPILDGG